MSDQLAMNLAHMLYGGISGYAISKAIVYYLTGSWK